MIGKTGSEVMWLDAKAVKYSGLFVKLIHKAYIKQRTSISQKQWRIPELAVHEVT